MSNPGMEAKVHELMDLKRMKEELDNEIMQAFIVQQERMIM